MTNRRRVARGLCTAGAVLALWTSLAIPQQRSQNEELLTSSAEPGRHGGSLVVAQRTEPKTLNPVVAVDSASKEVIGQLMADLIHIDRQSHRTGAALAKSWKVSRDGRRYTLQLRRGIRFSDGHPFDSDDVLFTFQVYLDETVHSPQRDLLIVAGQPIVVSRIDSHTVQFDLAGPYAAAERLFDSFFILPRHLLQNAYQEGKLAQAWNLTTPPAQLAGLGPFRLKENVPGQRIGLERNPYYWKVDSQGKRLPYLDRITFLSVGSEDAQTMRFQSGETDVLSRVSAENFSVLEKVQQTRGFSLHDLGPGLEYNFLLFNLNDLSAKNLPEAARRQVWFQQLLFRQAVSSAIDRAGIVRLVYRGRAAPLWMHVTPGNKHWISSAVDQPPRSLDRARKLLQQAGFSWKDGSLIDPRSEPVEFSILTSSANVQRTQIATIIQDDLKQLGMRVRVVSLESRSLLDRVLNTLDYEAAVLALASGDADPNSEMNVWLSRGSTHLWNLSGKPMGAPWEMEIDSLMQRQLVTLQVAERKRLYDRVQKLVAENLPLVCIASPNVLVGSKNRLGNFRPAILSDYTLWNAEELFFKQ